MDSVAPFVGAWIETIKTIRDNRIINVAPFVGAWIETRPHISYVQSPQSLLSQERGLKLELNKELKEVSQSLLSQERGLKQVLQK